MQSLIQVREAKQIPAECMQCSISKQCTTDQQAKRKLSCCMSNQRFENGCLTKMILSWNWMIPRLWQKVKEHSISLHNCKHLWKIINDCQAHFMAGESPLAPVLLLCQCHISTTAKKQHLLCVKKYLCENWWHFSSLNRNTKSKWVFTLHVYHFEKFNTCVLFTLLPFSKKMPTNYTDFYHFKKSANKLHGVAHQCLILDMTPSLDMISAILSKRFTLLPIQNYRAEQKLACITCGTMHDKSVSCFTLVCLLHLILACVALFTHM